MSDEETNPQEVLGGCLVLVVIVFLLYSCTGGCEDDDDGIDRGTIHGTYSGQRNVETIFHGADAYISRVLLAPSGTVEWWELNDSKHDAEWTLRLKGSWSKEELQYRDTGEAYFSVQIKGNIQGTGFSGDSASTLHYAFESGSLRPAPLTIITLKGPAGRLPSGTLRKSSNGQEHPVAKKK